MQKEFEKGNTSYGKLNQHRSALSLIFPGEIGKDILIRRFLKGVYRLRPTKPRYNTTWNPQIVINYIDSLGPDETLPTLILTKKLATLLALATGHRIQTLYLIKVDNIIFDGEGVCIYITDQVKNSKNNAPQPFFKVPYFTGKPNLCVVSTLISYLEKTSEWRPQSEDYLFITAKDPYKRASKDTISRWIKQTLNAAGINTQIFSAYSTRHASTSAAARNGVSWDVIRKTAGWTKTSKVFAKFYNRPVVEDNNFAKSVLATEL
ncbi:uncharacterized protein LOC111691783 [Anoplophora glabripennis]|uniref:uncharacterized protein LOC111691783 n=1 Tax=Anoplophora glabripennis TaxID=217634 RepID=UPI000C759DE5|nr:uncharacterized protein LOC111691783 [Anoplophora glabripennis]